MPDNSKKEILIIANARRRGGLSGGDAIYESFIKYWPNCNFTVKTMVDIDFKPGFICYIYRIILGIWRAVRDKKKYDMVYSASDFLMDCLPAEVYARKGIKWLAGFYLSAFKGNRIHYYTQKFAYEVIKDKADMVIVTNPTMYRFFNNKKKTWINGGIDIKKAGLSNVKKEYDAVFCGRLHFTKGVRELIDAWRILDKSWEGLNLAIIGDGDIGIDKFKDYMNRYTWTGDNSIEFLGYMGDERYEVYKKSRIVVYPTPFKFDHFSIAPVEAMACGCPIVAFNTETMQYFRNKQGMKGGIFVESPSEERDIISLASAISYMLDDDRWEKDVLDAHDWAIRFDYKYQSRRVYNEVMGGVFNESIGDGVRWNGWDSIKESS